MSTSPQKVLVRKASDVLPSPRATDREYWFQFRQGLLQQLAALEKMLGISRRCRHCGNDISTKLG